jgi:hypothetical protein
VIDSRQTSSVGDDLAADHHLRDGSRLHRVDDLVLERLKRLKRQVSQVDGNEICLFTGCQLSDGQPKDIAACRCAKSERGGGRHRAPIVKTGFGERRRRTHLVKDTLTIVGAAPIRTKSDTDAAPKHLGQRSDPVAQEGVRAGAMHDSGPSLGHHVQFLIIEPHRVHCNKSGIE